MASIERTAYPRLKRVVSARELHEAFTPTTDEIGSPRHLGPVVVSSEKQRQAVDLALTWLLASTFIGVDRDKGGCRVATRDVFSAEEQAQFRGFPEIDRTKLIRYFTLTGADEAFARRFRTSRNVLAVAVQLCTLPWLGFVPDDVPSAPAAAVGRLSQRLGVPMGELRGYGNREQTRTDHLREVLAYTRWRTIDAAGWKDLDEFLFARAMEHDGPKVLFRLACEYLLSSRVVRPGVVHLLEHVATARARAREETWTRVAHLLPERRRAELDLLLVPDAYLGRTPLTGTRGETRRRVAPMHCCIGAPSEPYVPLVAAYGSSKPRRACQA